MCTFDLEHVGSFGGHSVHSFQKLGRNSKMARRKVKRMNIWATEVYLSSMLVF